MSFVPNRGDDIWLQFNPHMKTPDQCSNMEEIRSEIDALDQDVIKLLGRRLGYVKAAAKFKTSQTSVRAPERFKAMLEQRRIWAEQAGLSPDVIEKLYRDLVNHFIEEEINTGSRKVAVKGA